MTRTIHALLVGIDEYPTPIPTLHGCVNDIDAFASYLSARTGGESALKLKTLKNAEATRTAVIDAFRTHLGQAGAGDVALFYYSGHGSREQAPEEFWVIEPDRLDETIVCVDSRNAGSWDLADKEIAKLIGEVAAKGPHVAVIMDCCHSGSGTREIGTVVRRAPIDLRKRPIDSFLVSPNEAIAASRRDLHSNRFATTEGRHVLLAACRSDQTAKEYPGDGRPRGAFSFFLGDALKGAAGVPTYREMYARASALVLGQVAEQSPQIEATVDDDLDGVFLDGAIRATPATFTASVQNGSWLINGGASAGIPAPTGSDATRFALYAFDAPAEDLDDPTRAIATASAQQVMATTSHLTLEGGLALDPRQTYKALIVSLPTPPLGLRLEGDPAACDLARAALRTASYGGYPSPFVRESTDGETSEFRLLARDNQFVINRPNDERPLVAEIDGLNQAGAALAVRRLEHIARWTQTSRLRNPTSTIRPDEVKLAILVNGKDVSAAEIRLEYQIKDGREVAPTFRVGMTNTGQRTLFCGLLDLTQRFRVSAGLLKAGCVALGPGQTAWGNLGEPITATVPDDVWARGIIEYRDLLKLIVCTQEFDARLLEQPTLDMPVRRAATRSLTRNGSLNRLMRKVQTRELDGDSEPSAIDDWQTSEVAFTTVRPLATTTLPGPGDEAKLAAGVTLDGHPALRAEARLTTTPLSTRDIQRALPSLLSDDPNISQPWTFSASRGLDPGLSVLELTGVNDPSVVTPDAPLRVNVPLALRKNEHVIPVAFDGEFFLPLGRVSDRSANSSVVEIDRLPPPVSDERSLGGAIKIFFQKVVDKTLGREFKYPILGLAVFAADGSVTRTRDLSTIREAVAKARRIVLFVHGIIGETDTMVPSLQLARLTDGRPLADHYDLVLTFDYENLNTTIAENGRLLKERLEAVGLGAGHGKIFDIAAHSMGGLVSRWFIEREGGNQVASRLVMLGTPNGGSPWPKVVDWATLALAFGLNHLTAIAWPATTLGGLAGLIENPTVALNEMLSTSKALADLKASPDPGIPYVMLAGNTSIIREAVDPTKPEQKSLVGRLLAKLSSPELLHTVADPFFLHEANDVAVSVASMTSIPAGRTRALDVRPVACDHMSYFHDPAGVSALARVLTEGP